MSELKPCPFCGDPAVLDTYYDFYRVRCDYPECPGNVKNGDGIWYGTIEHAVQRWNTRAEHTCEAKLCCDGFYRCTECNHVMLPSNNYCSNCGAKVVDA